LFDNRVWTANCRIIPFLHVCRWKVGVGNATGSYIFSLLYGENQTETLEAIKKTIKVRSTSNGDCLSTGNIQQFTLWYTHSIII